MAKKIKADATVTREGVSLFLVRPLTDEAKRWLHENVDPEAQWWAGALVVEPRYAENLVRGMQMNGLEVR